MLRTNSWSNSHLILTKTWNLILKIFVLGSMCESFWILVCWFSQVDAKSDEIDRFWVWIRICVWLLSLDFGWIWMNKLNDVDGLVSHVWSPRSVSSSHLISRIMFAFEILSSHLDLHWIRIWSCLGSHLKCLFNSHLCEWSLNLVILSSHLVTEITWVRILFNFGVKMRSIFLSMVRISGSCSFAFGSFD